MNGKFFGDRAQQIVIGELAKYGIQVAFPLTDNLPFDLIAIADNRLFKIQVKGSSQGTNNETIIFDFSRNNWCTGEINRYTKNDTDMILGVDFRSNLVYVFDDFDFEKQNTIVLRLSSAKNNQVHHIHIADDYLLSKRVEDIFHFTIPSFDNYWSKRKEIQYDHTCKICGSKFSSSRRWQQFCSGKCSSESQRRVNRPSKEQLLLDISQLSWRSIGRKYGVSDSAVKKWARSYNLMGENLAPVGENP